MAKSLFNNYLSSLSVEHETPESSGLADNNDLFDQAENEIPFTKRHGQVSNLTPVASPSTKQKTESKVETPLQNNENLQKAIITKDMIITGSVEVVSDMDIHGVVHGNVTSQGNLLITGVVEGDIATKGVSIVSSKMQANISANEFIDIHENCEITGNLSSNNISINGSVKGNINATGHISLKEHAEVMGDLQTGSLEILKGAVINGKIAFTSQH